MNKVRLLAIALFIVGALILSGSPNAVACSGAADQSALDICYSKCREAYPGDSFIAAGARAACFSGCQIGCWAHETL